MPGVPPVPIPNTAVKPRAADGSWTLGPARVGCRQVFGPDVVKATSGPSFCPDSKNVGNLQLFRFTGSCFSTTDSIQSGAHDTASVTSTLATGVESFYPRVF